MFITTRASLSGASSATGAKRSSESGAALATALLMLALLSAIAMTVLAVVRTETRIAFSDLKRTQTFYAASSGIEKMTSDFSQLFMMTSRPSDVQLDKIANTPPVGLDTEGYALVQTLKVDDDTLTAMRNLQNIPSTSLPTAVMGSDSPFAGLNASVKPYTLTTRATSTRDGTQVGLTRQMNNYLIPIFQFGVFSDKDLEFWPQPPMTFNGRVHANGNIYFGGDVTFLQRVTTANEAVRDRLRNNTTNDTDIGDVTSFLSNPRFKLSNGTIVQMVAGKGSVLNGPNLPSQPRADGRGDFRGTPVGTNPAPDGTDNSWWKTSSKTTYGGLVLSKSTGVLPLQLPLQLQEIKSKQPLELIKRGMPDDDLSGYDALHDSRYHNKAQIRILIDDEGAGNGTSNAAGIPAGRGVLLSTWVPSSLDSGSALKMVTDTGGYATSTQEWYQGAVGRGKFAQVVRMVMSGYPAGVTAPLATATPPGNNTGGLNATQTEYDANAASTTLAPYRQPNGAIIPTGSGIKGRILIEIVPPPGADGVVPPAIDVTQTILSMGVTVGEPNAIIYLQRPAWAALMQGSRDRGGDSAHHNYLTYFLDNSVTNRRALADGEINKGVAFDASGFIYSNDNNMDDDTHTSCGSGNGGGDFLPCADKMARDDKPGPGLNKIVPINVYNVREGHINEGDATTVPYTRGITSVVDINMRNLARWVDGVYDTTLFNNIPAATSPKSTNISGSDGYVVYISDRRGDRVKGERNVALATIQTTNGTVDNEDIYGQNQADGDTPTWGEDVIDEGYDPNTSKNKKNSLQIDKCELPSPLALTSTGAGRPSGAVTAAVDATRYSMGVTVTEWNPLPPTTACTAANASSNTYWFRRAVRLFNGEKLRINGGTGKLSTTKGITISTENMAYIWGSYNTDGINQAPPLDASSLNDPAATSHYMPTTDDSQVPASIVADAIFPISKTWYDALPAMYPEGANARVADAGKINDTDAILPTDETAVRAGIIAGATLSSLGNANGYLDNLNGGVHNFPRFLETWTGAAVLPTPAVYSKRWNYVGSFIILYNSMQALGPWSVTDSVVYYPPTRNWAFDITFTDPMKLPPGTPQFQHVEPTGFRQIL